MKEDGFSPLSGVLQPVDRCNVPFHLPVYGCPSRTTDAWTGWGAGAKRSQTSRSHEPPCEAPNHDRHRNPRRVLRHHGHSRSGRVEASAHVCLPAKRGHKRMPQPVFPAAGSAAESFACGRPFRLRPAALESAAGEHQGVPTAPPTAIGGTVGEECTHARNALTQGRGPHGTDAMSGLHRFLRDILECDCLELPH